MVKFKYPIYVLTVGIFFSYSNLVFAQTSLKEARIIFVKADAKVQKAGVVEWVDAKEGMRLSDGDTLKTGKASALEISFDRENKNVLRLEENSTAILRGRWLREIQLPQGRIRSLIKRLGKDSSFEIRTPTAVAGARGSGWDVISEAMRDAVKAFEDEIFVRSFDEQGHLIKEITVREGWKTFIEKFQAPSELVELTDIEKKDWDSWKEDLSERTEAERTKGGAETGPEFNDVEQASGKIQERNDYKDQVFEAQEIERVDDRVATGEGGERGESEGTRGGKGGRQEY